MIKNAVPVAKSAAPKVAPAENKAAVKVLPSVQPMQLAADTEQQNSVEGFFEPGPGKMAPSSPFQFKFKSTSSILPPNHSPIQRKSSSTWAFQPNSVGTNSNSTAPVQRAPAPANKTGLEAKLSSEKVVDEVNDKPVEGMELVGDSIAAETVGYTDNEGDKELDGEKVEYDSGDKTKAGVAGIFGSVASLYALYLHAANAKANWKESDLSEKLGLGVEIVEAGGRLAGNIAGTVENFQEAGEEGAGEAAGFANKVGMGFADGLSALKTGVMTIYEVYKTYKLYKSDVEASKAEKAQAAVNIIKGLLTTAGKAVSSIKNIAEMLNQGSAGLASAVPGIGLALNAVDIAVGVYDIIKAHHSANEMQAIITATKAANAQADVKVLEHLKKINTDKVKNLGVNMALDFVALAGNIAACIPEPNSQLAGLSLKIIAGGGKLLVSFFNQIKGYADDNAANPESSFGQLFGNKENSSAEIKKRNLATVHFIASHFEAVDPPNDENAIKTNKEKVDPIIQAAGTDPQAFYREVKTKDNFNDGMVLIYKNMA